MTSRVVIRAVLTAAMLLAGLFALRAGRSALAAPLGQDGAAQSVLVVGPDGPYQSIPAALQAASPGDTIQVIGGRHAGNLVADKAVHLQGVYWPVLDGLGQGTVVTLAAQGASLRGFHITGSGSEPDRDHAGITVTAPDVIVEGNRLADVLFGVFVAQADRVVLRDNDITSKVEFDSGRKGDAIRLWYSQQALVEGNTVHSARDVVVWYSENLVVRQNRIENGRYGIHLMYTDDALITGNLLQNNSVGIYTMYSHGVTLTENVNRRQRGPSGYALGFKDASDIQASGNLLLDNHSGVFIDGTPFNPGSAARFTDNILAYNDIGVTVLTAVKGAEFSGNTFWENIEQVALQGGGQMAANTWRGNYWSDYAFFDADKDGVGEAPYHADRFFENLTDREPLLRALLFSPASQAIEFAAVSFPIFKPQPKFSDPGPMMEPADPPILESAAERRVNAWQMGLVSLGLLAAGGLAALSIFYSEIYRWRNLLAAPPGSSQANAVEH